jgi:hypothetical protein
MQVGHVLMYPPLNLASRTFQQCIYKLSILIQKPLVIHLTSGFPDLFASVKLRFLLVVFHFALQSGKA